MNHVGNMEITGVWIDEFRGFIRQPSNRLSARGKRRWRWAERNRMEDLLHDSMRTGEVGRVSGVTVYTTDLPAKRKR
jgi:hypothetical protein